MSKTLTGYEKELIWVVLDFERASLDRSKSIAEAMGTNGIDPGDLVEFDRLAKALRIDGLGDLGVDVIYGYTRGALLINDVFEVIEYAINEDNASIHDWLVHHE